MDSKKLLFALGSLKTGGAERNLAAMASYFADIGHDVTVVLFEDVVHFRLSSKVKLIVVGRKKSGPKMIKALSLYCKLARIVWEVRPFKAIGYARLVSQMLAMTLYPRVVARYDIFPRNLKWYKWISSLILFNFPNVRAIVCPSEEMLDGIKLYFLNPSKLVRIYNPILETNEVVVSRDLNLPKPFFIMVGRLTSQKRVDIAIRAFARSLASKNYHLLILGDGKERRYLETLIMDLKVAERVHLLGFLSSPQEIMSNARALLLTSAREGFPNVVIEALSEGIPVISTNCPTGPSEIIADNVNGYLVELNDIETLSKHIDALAFDDELHKKISSGTKKSVERFGFSHIASHWENLLFEQSMRNSN